MSKRKLSDFQKAEMKRLHEERGIQIKTLAERYGVGTATAWLACHGMKDFDRNKTRRERGRHKPIAAPTAKRTVIGPIHPKSNAVDGEAAFTYRWEPQRSTIPTPPTTMPGSLLKPIPLERLMAGK